MDHWLIKITLTLIGACLLAMVFIVYFGSLMATH